MTESWDSSLRVSRKLYSGCSKFLKTRPKIVKFFYKRNLEGNSITTPVMPQVFESYESCRRSHGKWLARILTLSVIRSPFLWHLMMYTSRLRLVVSMMAGYLDSLFTWPDGVEGEKITQRRLSWQMLPFQKLQTNVTFQSNYWHESMDWNRKRHFGQVTEAAKTDRHTKGAKYSKQRWREQDIVWKVVTPQQRDKQRTNLDFNRICLHVRLLILWCWS